VVIRDGEDVFVLDAKDYDFEHPRPPGSDVHKQILYRLMGSQLFERTRDTPLSRVRNGFLVPVRRSSPVCVLSVHRLVSLPPSDWGDIVVLGVDLERVAAHYAQGRRDNHLRAEVVKAVRSIEPTSNRHASGAPK
jgi:hypothetical protein